MKRFLFFTLFLGLTCQFLSAQQSAQLFYKMGNEAYEGKKYKKYLQLMRQADELLPNHPTITEGLVRGYALTGRKTRSIQHLRKLLMMDATFEFQEDSDLKSIVGSRGYQGVVNLKRLLLNPEVNDELYRTIETDSLHVEGLVILDNGDLLLSSVHQKKIVRVDSAGNITDLLETPYSALGMKVDTHTGFLWVATAAMPEMLGFEEEDRGHSVIFQIDIESGNVKQAMSFEEEEMYGDLVLDSLSRIWLTNSQTPYLSRDNTEDVQSYGSFVRKQMDLSGTHFNLQGLTLNEDESALYFADYQSGLYRMRVADDHVDEVLANSDFLLKGIDGLYYYKNSLIAIKNGVKPNQVVQYYLDEEGLNIIGRRVINRGGAGLGEPTLGQIKEGYFYYIANSPWGAYNEDGRLQMEKVSPLQIRRFKLD